MNREIPHSAKHTFCGRANSDSGGITVRTRAWSYLRFLLSSCFFLLFLGSRAAASDIYVTTIAQGVADDGRCSLQEAIYSANLDFAVAPSSFNPVVLFNTGCQPGNGADVIHLRPGAIYWMSFVLPDPYNPLGPTATPIVVSDIRIEGEGATLARYNPARDFSGTAFRAFAVAGSNFADRDHDLYVANTTGRLTLRNLYIRGFIAKGGNGAGPAGGGMGAGGAIYVREAGLVVENSTFVDNGAGGGNSGQPIGGGSGGGGGLGGNGGMGKGSAGGGGGGARGDGGFSNNLGGVPGGGGGGTVENGQPPQSDDPGMGGYRNGGDGGAYNRNGAAGREGGGGGGGGNPCQIIDCLEPTGGEGGNGGYGGGGGGGGDGSNAGDGGFGGGGGDTSDGAWFGGDGGDGGFGGGAGRAGRAIFPGRPGRGGSFGGDDGGGGAGLGGAIFGDTAQITIANSTFYGNYVLRGLGHVYNGHNGRDAGGAIFLVDGSLVVRNSTLYRNESTGNGGGLVVYRSTRSDLSASLSLLNNIFAQNTSFTGRGECHLLNSVSVVEAAGNLITNNSTDDLKEDADGSPYRDPRACPGQVSDADPALQPLRMNAPGLTPTLAILRDSAAADAADVASSLGTDQRGVSRPQLNGPDIGAYEARAPHYLFHLSPPTEMALGDIVPVPVTVTSEDGFTGTVGLTVRSLTPNGPEATIDAASVILTPDQAAVSTMTLRAGATTVAGDHTVELKGAADGVSNRFVWIPIRIGVTTEGMARTIDELRLTAEIANLGIGTALTTKLTAAQTLIDGGDLQAGVNTLAAFGLQVRALSGKQIAADAALRLLANLDVLVASVSPQASPNPLIGLVTDAAGLPVEDATVTIYNDKSIVASAMTDAAGLYYVARTTHWVTGANYSAKVTLPKTYKRSAPSVVTFAWSGSQVTLPSFVLSR